MQLAAGKATNDNPLAYDKHKRNTRESVLYTFIIITIFHHFPDDIEEARKESQQLQNMGAAQGSGGVRWKDYIETLQICSRGRLGQ